jgi:hypothetical protein
MRRGLIEQPEAAETPKDKSARWSKFRAAKSELLAAGLIGIDGRLVRNLTPSAEIIPFPGAARPAGASGASGGGEDK